MKSIRASVLTLIGLFIFFLNSPAISQPVVVRVNPAAEYNISSKDDIEQLKILANGVGHEFETNDQTNEGLRQIGIKIIRCINVEPLPGHFDKNGQYVIDSDGVRKSQLMKHLDTCRAIGAVPHIILATKLPNELVNKIDSDSKNIPSIMGIAHNAIYGPSDWKKYRDYYLAVFKFVLIDQKFPTASFEVGNEPDIGGVIIEKLPVPANGSRRLYEAYLKLYRSISRSAEIFEKQNPGVHVTLGGPALAWAYTFKFGDFNWMGKFIEDVSRENLKIDFVSLHYYGNISPIDKASQGTYPSFSEMFSQTRVWRDKYLPDKPIWITEWGASYHTNLTPGSILNGNNVGAAFAAAFLNQMLLEGIDRAMYLVTTDLRRNIGGKWKDIWGWPAFFTNPTVSGTQPKAPYNVFKMITMMAPKRVEATRPTGTVGCIASRDDVQKRLTVLIWNNSCDIPEFGAGRESGPDRFLGLKIIDADKFFDGPVSINRYMISRTLSNAYYLFEHGLPLDEKCHLQKIEESIAKAVNGTISLGFSVPSSSVVLIEILDSKKEK